MIYFLEGKPGNTEQRIAKQNMIFFNHMTSTEMARLIRGASSIICRSGYSTIMDLVSTGSSAILVPTPGQTEQEYLAEYLNEKGMFRYISQKELNGHSINIKLNSQGYREILSDSRILLEKALDELLQHTH
jgi:UDP-N-acetylglucosamine:LPS N-acetylglucosamine transferase